jgi:hypothetical protein
MRRCPNCNKAVFSFSRTFASSSLRGVECPSCDAQVGHSWPSKIFAASPLLIYATWARLARPEWPLELYGLVAAGFFTLLIVIELPLKKLR